jgi:hypothetical protein
MEFCIACSWQKRQKNQLLSHTNLIKIKLSKLVAIFYNLIDFATMRDASRDVIGVAPQERGKLGFP